jgi:hypothetical protein
MKKKKLLLVLMVLIYIINTINFSTNELKTLGDFTLTGFFLSIFFVVGIYVMPIIKSLKTNP